MSTAPHRARVFGTRHMVAAGHHLAAQAAFQILEAGGNAIDAGVAGGIALVLGSGVYLAVREAKLGAKPSARQAGGRR